MLGMRTRMIVLPLLVAILVLSVQAFRKPLGKVTLDEFYYLTIARDLLLHGVFTNGTYKRGPFGRTEGPATFNDEDVRWAQPGRFFAPVYPMFVFGLARLDKGLADSVRCHVREANTPAADQCPRAFATLVAVQVVLWAIVALVIFQMGWTLARSEAVAWLAMIIALATGEPGYYARTYLSENVTVPAFCLFMLFAMRAVERRWIIDVALAGLALGIASLARPAYAYLLYVLVPLFLLATLLRPAPHAVLRPRMAGVFAVAACLALAPWILRNLATFGDPALSSGYAEVILPQRLAYNQMSWAEWGVAWIYWLPDFGDDVAKKLFKPSLYELLSWNHPQNYYLQGGGGFMQKILAEAATDAAVMPLLVRKYLLGDLFKHVAVSLPLTMRGLGIGGYLSVAGVALAWPAIRLFRQHGTLMPFLAVAAGPLFMAGLHGFVSVNIARYNLPMIAVYAVVVATVVVSGFERLQARNTRGTASN